jgi:DeoR/GlpR family transcriptional regulator of sugar metabolism
LDLSEQAAPVPKSEIRRLSPRLVEDYFDKTDKTLQRDLSDLEKDGLIVIENGMVRANLNMLVAFLPHVREGVI